MLKVISITGIGSISALGCEKSQVFEAYQNSLFYMNNQIFEREDVPVASLDVFSKEKLQGIRNEIRKYRDLDDSVLMAIHATRQAMQSAGWKNGDDFGVNIGSSRGATALFERYYDEFKKTGQCSTLASPTTTLGNISSWVAQDVKANGIDISHSITCSTALHAVANAVAWLKSGMAQKFIVGGSEAPLTDFTIAQMKALKIYSERVGEEYPCLSLDEKKKRNTMVLGEGASVICLEKEVTDQSLAIVRGIGYATESLLHNISISANADCLQKSMKMALKDVENSSVDVVVMHAPGTIKGDLSEINAVKSVFGKHLPLMTSNKWKIGHTFGASGMLSVEMALYMLLTQNFVPVPYLKYNKIPQKIHRVLVNAVGFGGNAVSILLEKV